MHPGHFVRNNLCSLQIFTYSEFSAPLPPGLSGKLTIHCRFFWVKVQSKNLAALALPCADVRPTRLSFCDRNGSLDTLAKDARLKTSEKLRKENQQQKKKGKTLQKHMLNVKKKHIRVLEKSPYAHLITIWNINIINIRSMISLQRAHVSLELKRACWQPWHDSLAQADGMHWMPGPAESVWQALRRNTRQTRAESPKI